MRRKIVATLSDLLHRYFQFLKGLCQDSEFIRSETVTRRIREDNP
jgi:hypothetical protein